MSYNCTGIGVWGVSKTPTKDGYILSHGGHVRAVIPAFAEQVAASLNKRSAVIIHDVDNNTGDGVTTILLPDGRSFVEKGCLTINLTGKGNTVCTEGENQCIHSRIAKNSDKRAEDAESIADEWIKFSEQTLGVVADLNSAISRLANLIGSWRSKAGDDGIC